MEEVRPPWVTYPGYPPSDTFWRQPGEAWAVYVWMPFWTSLNDEEKSAFLDKWDAPEEWRDFYSAEFQAMLAEIDGPAGFILRNNLSFQSEASADADAKRIEERSPKEPAGFLGKVRIVLRTIVLAFGTAMIVLGFLAMLKDRCNINIL